jgi:predicted membrane GTPase involved in stress response
MVTKIMDNNGIEHTTPITILRTITEYMRGKYDAITVDENTFRQLVGHVNRVLPQEANSALEAPITI